MKYLILTSLSLFLLSVVARAQSFEPGQWSTNESLSLGGMALPATQNEDCITPEQGKDAKATIGAALKKQGCSITKWVVKKQVLDAALACDSDTINATGTLHGTFTKKSYDLDGDAKGKIKNTIPATATLKLTGKWIGACPDKKK